MTDHTDAQQAATTPSFADLAGAVAVVTGGSGTLGGAASRALAANGAVVAVGGRDRSAIDATVDQIRAAGGQAIAAIADCTDRKALEQMGHDVADQLGPVDVLVAFAGGGRQPTSNPRAHRTGVARGSGAQPHRHVPHHHHPSCPP